MTRLSLPAALLALLLTGCPEPVVLPTWRTVATGLDEAALSVSAEPNAVWVVGADRSHGPLVLRFAGGEVTRLTTGFEGDLWWVQAFPDGTALMGGTAGLLLRYDGEGFQRLATPSFGRQTIFGIWGKSSQDAWIVGGAAGREGFIWKLSGTSVTDVGLPVGVPLRADGENPALLKVWGDAEGTVWVVGDRGTLLRRGAADATFEVLSTPSPERYFTVHGAAGTVSVVGGNSSGVIVERSSSGELRDAAPADLDLIQGVFRTSVGSGWAVGAGGLVLERDNRGWRRAEGTQPIAAESLHAVTVDAQGRVWAVGGNVLSPALNQGVVLVRSPSDVPGYVNPEYPVPPVVCPADDVAPAPDKSIARQWNEQLLNAIRRDTPRPGVHARNLFHVSAAMYDAWAAFDATADGVFAREKVSGGADLEHQRDVAISYAALRVLEHRYSGAIGGGVSMACFHAFMQRQGLDPNDTTATGTSGLALGNRVGAAVIAANRDDGANEGANYADPSWAPLNPPMVVDLPGTTMTDPSKWQQLNLAQAVTQNGIVQPGGVQGYIGANWGSVKPFALPERTDGGVLYLDPGAPPRFDDDVKPMVVDVLRKSGWLDPADATEVDLSPGAMGNNSLGADDGTGRPLNPVTGQPYAANKASRADFGRVLAEFWADGPKSETPPGHWNVLANQVADSAGFERKWLGQGAALPALEWDVKVYLALNGAVHDAAIVAWGTKRVFQCTRPISLVRHMAALGQSSDPMGAHYHPMGLPLVPGLIELVTTQSSAPGQKHAHLRAYVGHVAIRTWRGEPGDRRASLGGVGWVRAVEWMPYQRRTFVTPAFPGFTSGHSTFSRAAAEVLTELTGSAFFPGGLASFTAPVGYLTFERGPTKPVTLQWATYFDAADQAGQSRIWGGIHINIDDYSGRRTGAEVGTRAAARALTFFDGTAVP